MRARLGNLLFRYRNAMGPILLMLVLALGSPSRPFDRPDLDVLLDVIGILVALAGQGLRILTIGYEYIERGGRNRQVYATDLVQGGVFAQCRNPLYVGNLLMCVGFGLIVHSLVYYLMFLPLVVLAYVCIVAAEEEFLRNKFGTEYQAYCQRVPRWLPRLTGWKDALADMQFNWRRVVVKEYNTVMLLELSLTALRWWSEYRIEGIGALPSRAAMATAFAAWLLVYLGVRTLKKRGWVRG